MLQLYARDKMVRSAISDQNGRVRFDPLPSGEYRVVVPHKGTLDLVVLPFEVPLDLWEKSGR